MDISLETDGEQSRRLRLSDADGAGKRITIVLSAHEVQALRREFIELPINLDQLAPTLELIARKVLQIGFGESGPARHAGEDS